MVVPFVGWLGFADKFVAQGIQESGPFSCGCVFEPFLPGVDGRGKPVLKFDQLMDLPFQRSDLFRGQSRDAMARCSARIPLSQYSGELGEAEPRFDGAADRANAGDCAGVVKTVTALGTGRLP